MFIQIISNIHHNEQLSLSIITRIYIDNITVYSDTSLKFGTLITNLRYTGTDFYTK